MSARSKCDRCNRPLYGLIPCPQCREEIISKAIAEEVSKIAALVTPELVALDLAGQPYVKGYVAGINAAIEALR